ncbi:MAG: aminotransferase class I/II-fold pyridoxal phosphate-dependent enzyme [Gammaproteobacteria bacterium]|nr:aminotransferase class I/II-fold pyridoxal phosphate-dependent enzyme [Gammaproteobacteria bacterium]
MEPRIAERMAQIAPFHVMEVMGQAARLEAEGRDIVHMEVGEPDFPSPEAVIQAGTAALQAGETHYTLALGIPPLREAIAEFYQSRHGVEIAPERIIITPGASGAFQLLMGALIDPGSEVITTDPGYPCNRNFIRLAGGTPVSVPVDRESNWQLNGDLIEQCHSSRTSAVMLASPSNPTGTTVPNATLREIVTTSARLKLHLIVDEIYQGLTYDGDSGTALRYSDDLFVINSFSKFFGMTGWRLGWLIAPPAYLRPLEKLAQNLFISPPTIAQHAALRAFEPDVMALLEERRLIFKARRDYLAKALRELGFDLPKTPEGAFYLYPGCQKFSHNSSDFCLELLNEAGVAMTPGIDFGSHRALEHLRVSYTTSMERLEEGVARLSGYLATR